MIALGIPILVALTGKYAEIDRSGIALRLGIKQLAEVMYRHVVAITQFIEQGP